MGMMGVRAGRATQADGVCLPLFNIGCLDLAVNGEPISHSFVSAPLSHCDIILGESWLRQHHGVLIYAHNNLLQWAEAGLQLLTFSKPRPPEERLAVWAWAGAPGQVGVVGSASVAIPSESYLCQLSQSGSQATTLADIRGPTADHTGLLQTQSTSLNALLALTVEQGMQQERLALSQAPLPLHLAIPGTYYCPPPTVGARVYHQERRQAMASSQALLARQETVFRLVQQLTRLQACSEASLFLWEARESWQPTLHMMGLDLGKELTEDALLGESSDIPGLVPTGERLLTSSRKRCIQN